MSSGTRIVICGGGAIGAAIAYFTSRGGARSTVIERHTVAGAASGKRAQKLQTASLHLRASERAIPSTHQRMRQSFHARLPLT